jgi:hypothetical protein
MTEAIRPALDTLRELDQGRFLDKLAVAIHDAVSGVSVLGKPAKVNIAIEFAPLSKQGLSEPVITAEVELVTKLPKPDAPKAIFYIDGDGNPTTQQQRQRDLGLQVADGDHQQRKQA